MSIKVKVQGLSWMVSNHVLDSLGVSFNIVKCGVNV